MDNLKKSFLIIILIIGIIAISIAFAALSSRLSISGTADVPDTNWNIHFDNWTVDTASTVTYSGITHQNTAEYPSIATLENSMSLKPNVTKVENVNITLKQPGDYAKYNFEIVNSGTIDASLDSFTPLMACESGKNCDFLTYEVKCFDNQNRIGNEVTVSTNNTLSKNGGKAYCYLSVTYNDQTNTGNTVYSQEAVSATLSANWTWVQKKDNSQSGNSGTEDIQVPEGSYLITYNSNGGTGSMNGQVIDPTVSNTLTTNTYTKSGYTFAGWNEQADGSGTSYTNGQVLAANTVSSNMALYAEWMNEGWSFENRESISNPRTQVENQQWSYYRNGVKVQNELLYVPGSYEDVVVATHHYLIVNGYMHIGWYEEGGEYYYFSTTPGKYGWVQGFRYESTSKEIDGVTYTFDAQGRATPKPQQQAQQQEETWDSYYTYDMENYESIQQSAFDNSWNVWIRKNTNKEEACGKINGVTKCLKFVSYADYVSDVTCTNYNECTATGYVKQVVDDFEAAGAQCYLYESQMDCSAGGVTCEINTGNEQSNCYNSDYTCAVYDWRGPLCY